MITMAMSIRHIGVNDRIVTQLLSPSVSNLVSNLGISNIALFDQILLSCKKVDHGVAAVICRFVVSFQSICQTFPKCLPRTGCLI